MYLVLIAYMCLGNECTSARVTDTYLSPEMTISGCMMMEGELSAARFVAQNYHDYRLTKWACQIGKKPTESSL